MPLQECRSSRAFIQSTRIRYKNFAPLGLKYKMHNLTPLSSGGAKFLKHNDFVAFELRKSGILAAMVQDVFDLKKNDIFGIRTT